MSVKKVAVLSSLGRAMTEELKLVKNQLEDEVEDYEFNYFFLNEKAGNSSVKKGVAAAKKDFCSIAQHYISIDGSLPKMVKNDTKCAKILLLSHYDYLFKESKTVEPKKTFEKYTHIICGSPFAKRVLKENYKLDTVTVIDEVCLPMAYETAVGEKRKIIYDRLKSIYPHIVGKKIVSLAITGKNRDSEAWNEEVLLSFLKELGENYFFITNSGELLELSKNISGKYIDRMGYVDSFMMLSDLVYVSDMLCTDSGQIATTFVATGNTTISYGITNNAFTEYMNKAYPTLSVDSAEALARVIKGEEELVRERKRFYNEFFYPTEVNPYDVIREILKKER